MLEWLVTIGAAELGKAVFEQVLKLGQAAAEDYVKDFFKGCLQGGITAAKPEVTKKAVAEALKAFLLIVTDELEDQDLSKAEIRDRYDPALVQFIQNNSVKPILGKAFEKDCKAIETTTLSTLWQEGTLRGKPFPTLPEEFDWQRVGSEYLKKVRRIIRETPELKSLLETELLEDIARNTTQFSPGFDVASYRKSLQCSYGHLKLYAIDSTDRVDAIKLWTMFIEQTVREALPPMRYELPLDLKRQLQEQGELAPDLSPEALEHYRQDYFQQPSRKVLAAVADSQRAVILGDPGAGKSTLLQYLALDWVEGKTESLPLLVELREYANSQSHNFLDFLHRGRGVDWQFDQQQLHQHLQEQPTRVMFDGLDEVFDRSTQSTIIDDIIRFTQQYPKAQILITSRIIGYNPERLQQANFRHFTIQPLNTDEIHEFIDRWYDLSLGSDPDKTRLKQRLKDAIANSKAIQNLADNPLLLTMMAILNRRQELPRDRADLYDQASRVLLYHWDVDHKRLQLPMDAIGRREKQEMLRAIAYEMQAGEEGLKGNLISADRLTRIITDYLRDQGFSEPREKANRLIQQLRERNFILCYRGVDTYGFMHRTFLEYFCAVEIVHRFEKQRTLTFDQLRDEVFGQHWQDETWHEVLKLICGAVGELVANILIDSLLVKEDRTGKFLTLTLAANCLSETRQSPDRNALSIEIVEKCLNAAQKTASERINRIVNYRKLIQSIEEIKINKEDFLFLLDNHLQARKSGSAFMREPVMQLLIRKFPRDPEILTWLKAYAKSEEGRFICSLALQGLAMGYADDPETLSLLKNWLNTQDNRWEKRVAAESIAYYFNSNTEVFSWLKHCSETDQNEDTRARTLDALIGNNKDRTECFLFLNSRIQNESSDRVRAEALEILSRCYTDEPGTLPILLYWINSTESPDIERSVMRALARDFKDDPKTLEILQLKAKESNNEYVRGTALRELAENFRENSDLTAWIMSHTKADISAWVRGTVLYGFARDDQFDSGIFSWFVELARLDKDFSVRSTAIELLSEVWNYRSEVLNALIDCAISDPFIRQHESNHNPRLIALESLFTYYPTYPKTLELLHDRATNDPDEQLRQWAQEKLKIQNVKLKIEESSNG